MIKEKKLSAVTLALMLFAALYGFVSPGGYYLMGYSAIPIYTIASIIFFIPFVLMIIEYGVAFRYEKGGIYSWMENSVGERYALITIFMWYSAVIVFLVSLSSFFWIRFSGLLFGKDLTESWELLGLNPTQTVGLLAILFIILLTFVSTKGLKQIARIGSYGGVAGLILNLILFVGALFILFTNNGHFAEPVTLNSFLQSPNPDNNSILATISFITYAVLGYGGMELAGGYVDKTNNPEDSFPKAAVICALLITLTYSIGVILIGVFTNYGILVIQDTNLGNAIIVVMNNFGYELGLAFGFSDATALVAGEWMTRLYSFSAILMICGQLATLLFSPVRQLIEGTPKKFWPGKIAEIKDGLPKRAMWIQCCLIIILLSFVSFSGRAGSSFFNIVLLSSAVALSVPYVLIAIAFPSFKNMSEIKKPVTIFKSWRSTLIWTLAIVLSVGFSIVITVIRPALSGDFFSSVVMVVGPLIFLVIALLLYRRYKQISKSENKYQNL